jgi:uncharacterized membrane protein YeaQ/YmgE (transglycosylase-associated protein family)
MALIVGAIIGGQLLHSFNESFLGYYLVFIGGSAGRILVAFTYEYMTRDQKDLLISNAD